MRSVDGVTSPRRTLAGVTGFVLAVTAALVVQTGNDRADDARYCMDLGLRDTLPGWAFNPVTQKFEQMPFATFKPCTEVDRSDKA